MRWGENLRPIAREATRRMFAPLSAVYVRRVDLAHARRMFAPHGAGLAAGVQSLRRDSLSRGAYARLARRGYATLGSVSTLTSAGLPAAKARSKAGRSSPGVRTSSPWPPSACTTWS